MSPWQYSERPKRRWCYSCDAACAEEVCWLCGGPLEDEAPRSITPPPAPLPTPSEHEPSWW